MGRWERPHRDTTVPDVTRHDTGEGHAEPPPTSIHLDLDDDSASPASSAAEDDAQPWRRWFGFCLALLVAAVAGVIGANARHDAVDRTQIDLIGGEATASFAGRPEPETPAWEAEYMVFNAGVRTVDILEVNMDGWTRPPDARLTEPVAARPGEWTSVHASLTPECGSHETLPEPGAALVVNALVRSGNRETDVPITFAPGGSWFRDFWAMTCAPTDAPYPEVLVHAVEILSPGGQPDTLRTRLFLTLADGGGRATLVRIWSHVPGFGSHAVGLPIELRGDDVSEVNLTWQVESCEPVDQVETAQLSLHLATGDGPSGARLRSAPVPDQVLIDLGTLFAQVCGL